jgi:probable phosphoglycerate mutase
MRSDTQDGREHNGAEPAATPADVGAEAAASADAAAPPRKLLLLVRHGETTYNVERRLPGQLPGVSLTDEGRRQALRAAVALGGLPLSAIVSSPLERACATAEIIARGRGLPIRLESGLMDTDVGRWAGWVVDDLAKADPEWPEFVKNPDNPPAGIESQSGVMARAVEVIERLRREPEVGEYVVAVAHADVIKLIVAHYTGVAASEAQRIHIANASISALRIAPEGAPSVLGVNWTSTPDWLTPRPATQDGDVRKATGGEVEGLALEGSAATPDATRAAG